MKIIKSGNGNVFIIAEAGVNHNGEINLAKKLIDTAIAAGVDAVKFQTFKPGEITGKYAVKVDYLAETSDAAESRFELSKKLCLSYENFIILKQYCDQRGIMFLTTPDGFESLDFVVDQLQVPIIKVGSSEANHLEFLTAVAKKNRPIILSTGMCTLGEVETAVNTIRQHTLPELVILHCTSEYPAPYNEVNLRAMVTMAQALHVPVGFSDHTEGFIAPIAAVALGAQVIEKHFTLDKSLPGPDHKASMNPVELTQLVEAIRTTEKVLGDGLKRPSTSELRNIVGIRRGVVAARDISKGTIITREMLAAKRPFVEISPNELNLLIGMTLNRNLKEDEPIHWKDVK